ncbi:MAG: hypothetical protein HC822_24155, partial [Oscillochloris sp.]|nr:hypothetical protein [Oscillochloris sp.]
MHATTRNWFAAALLMLVAATLLHTTLLFGVAQVWSALVHLTLFGWITAMIMAVNYHTMPVFTGRDFPYAGLIRAQLACFISGVSLTAVGQLSATNALILAGLSGELAAALLFMLNVALLLSKGVRRSLPPAPPPVAGQKAVDRVGTRAT